MQAEEVSYTLLRNKCSDDSFDCYATAYIFNKRSIRFKRWINLLKVFGILTPAMVGITAISWGSDNKYLPTCISIAVIILVVQFAFSILAVIYQWDDELAYSFEASQDYNSLWDGFKRLAELPPNEYKELDNNFESLNMVYRLREQQDTKRNIKEWEYRKGMRWALREYKKPCYGCKEIILSMRNTKCDVCGKFSLLYRIKSIFSL